MKGINKFSILALIILICLLFYHEASSQTLKAVNDTIDLYPGIPITFNLLANDTIPYGDSIRISGGEASSTLINATPSYRGFFTYLVKPYWGFNGTQNGSYRIIDVTLGRMSSATILFRIHDHSCDSLDINNVKAAITAYGNQFFLPAGLDRNNLYKIPKNSQTGTVFNLSLWVGGKGVDSSLYLAAERYRQGPSANAPGSCPDFYAGPVMDSVNYSIYQDTLWSRTWKVTKAEIENHKTHWNTQGYIAPANIVSWPGNGNTSYGQAAELAPFFDRNGDGKYNAANGDYPSIMGDEAIYVIYNDDRDIHKETRGQKMRLEIHLMAYAFDLPDDSAFKNTIFLNYKIYNRSSRTYYNTYLGAFVDLDVGFPADDFIGCDVKRSSFIGFNGKPVDGTGQSNAYGAHPPAQSVTILGGPFMDPAGYDRPRFDHLGHQLCNESINGTGFGDSIANNERYGLTNFLAYTSDNSNENYNLRPQFASEYYHVMQSIWVDSTRLLYGGQGHEGFGGYGPNCRFIFPGVSDSLNWGAGCQAPNGQVNWTEATAEIAPNDISGIGGMGPFTFHPGDVQQLDLALVFAHDYNGTDSLTPSVAKLDQMIDIVRNSYNTGFLPNGTSFFGIDNQPTISSDALKIYPNPASETINLLFNQPIHDLVNIQLINANGMVVYSSSLNVSGKKIQLDVSRLAVGIYVIHVQTREFSANKKAVIIH